MSQIVADVKRAIVKACMANGVEDLPTILAKTAEAINGFGEMTVAAHKAWATMDKRNYKKHLAKNRKILNRR